MKITIHIDIEITDDGKLCVTRSSYTPSGRAAPGPCVQPDELIAFAAAFVGARQAPLPPPPPIDAIDISTGTMFPEVGELRPALVRGARPSALPDSPPPPPPPTGSAWRELVTLGVSVEIAQGIEKKVGAGRAKDIARWMKQKGDVRDPTALARRLMDR